MSNFTFNPAPTPQQQSLLNQIMARESSGNYGVTISQATCDKLMGYPGATCTASGAYGMIDATWQTAAQAVGVDTSQYPTAASAPPAAQDAAALWLLEKYGPNSSMTWGASAPSGGYQAGGALVDVSGDAAVTPTPSIMDSLTAQAANVGIDLTNPVTEAIVAVAAIAAVLLVGRRL